MTISIGLFSILQVNEQHSDAEPVYIFSVEDPIPAGTTFEYKGKRYVHYADLSPVQLMYIEEQEVRKVE